MPDLNAEQITALVAGELDAGRFRIARAWLNVLIALEDDLQTKWGPTDSGVPLVNVPVLKYGDRCEAHGYDTYVLDGVTFHRATMGVCTDTSAPPRAWSAATGEPLYGPPVAEWQGETCQFCGMHVPGNLSEHASTQHGERVS